MADCTLKQVFETNDLVVFQVSGHIADVGLEMFSNVLLTTLQLSKKKLILDFSGVKYISSSGVGALVHVCDVAQDPDAFKVGMGSPDKVARIKFSSQGRRRPAEDSEKKFPAVAIYGVSAEMWHQRLYMIGNGSIAYFREGFIEAVAALSGEEKLRKVLLDLSRHLNVIEQAPPQVVPNMIAELKEKIQVYLG